MIQLIPGDPAVAMAGVLATPEQVASLYTSCTVRSSVVLRETKYVQAARPVPVTHPAPREQRRPAKRNR